jgi:hypothetical protein
MDRYTQFGLRGDEDDLFRRAVRDGFKRAGLGNDRLTQALEWFRDCVRPGMDQAKLAESFNEFAASKGWPAEQLTAAVAVYGAVRDQGPAAVMSPAPTSEEDVATVARADELLRSNPEGYWRDHELQEAVLEARERQRAAPPPEPSVDPYAIERRIAEGDVDKFSRMMREEPGKYWGSPELQRQHHDAIEASIQEAPANPPPAAVPAAAPVMQPTPVVASPPPAAEPVKP